MEDMKHTIQATGHLPQTIDFEHEFVCTEMLEGDKRGVTVTLYKAGGEWLATVTYLTTWGTEREFCRSTPMGTLEQVADSVREMAKTILPPGAGFPAMPQYETRQAKLAGMMETLTLTALSKVLAEAAPGEPDDS